MENHDNEQQYKKIQSDIKEVQSKYNAISEDVKSLKTGQSSLQEHMGMINSNLEKMSKNVEDMMNRLGSIMEEQQKSAVEEMIHKKGGMLSALIKKPLRRLAVGTVGMALAVGDFTAEKFANAREGLEDIVAEANYNRKMKRQEQQTQEA
jgi:predicted nuclease with TOPRIM domain